MRDAWIVPVVDLAKVNARQNLRRKLQVAADARHVIHGHHRAKHGGDVEQLDLGLAKLLVGHGTVGRAEIADLLRNLANTRA